MRRAAVPLIFILALAACQERDAAPVTDLGDETADVTAPVSPGTAPNDGAAAYPPPGPNPLGGDSTGLQATPGTDTRGAVAPGTTANPSLPSTPPTLPPERPPPAPVTSPQ